MIGLISAHKWTAAESHDRIANEFIDDEIMSDKLFDYHVHHPFEMLRKSLYIGSQLFCSRRETHKVNEQGSSGSPVPVVVCSRMMQKVLCYLSRESDVEKTFELVP